MPKKIQPFVISVMFIGSLLFQAVLAGGLLGAAQAATTWWPDGNDVANDARATWVYFSIEFTANYSTTALVDASVLEMRNKKVDVLIASLTSTDMTGLSNPAAARTVLYQRMVDQAAGYGMAVYVGYWEDEFSGSSGQMSSYTAVDNVINFNNNNGAQADVAGVVSDYEMHSNNRTATRYAQWRQFHNDLNNRIGANPLKLIPVLNDPAVLINNCNNSCDAAWKTANGISGSNPNYSGDVNYFTSYNSVRFADGYIGMYYYSSPASIQSNAHDDIVEANGLTPAAPVVVGFSVGPNFDPTLLTEADVNTAVSNNEAERATYPNGTLGVMGWRWDDPADGDAEYRGVISSQPPGGATATPTNTPSGPTNTPTPTVTPGGAPTMHVADMLTTDINGNPKPGFLRGEKIYWRVKIVDQAGNPVSGASVTTNLVKPNGTVWTTLTSSTDAGGWALFNKGTLNNSATGTYTINVTGVTKTGVSYDSGANVVSSITCTLT